MLHSCNWLLGRAPRSPRGGEVPLHPPAVDTLKREDMGIGWTRRLIPLYAATWEVPRGALQSPPKTHVGDCKPSNFATFFKKFSRFESALSELRVRRPVAIYFPSKYPLALELYSAKKQNGITRGHRSRSALHDGSRGRC